MRKRVEIVGVLVAAWLATSAYSFMINFDEEPYAPGAKIGNIPHSSGWSGKGDEFSITAGAGINGTTAAVFDRLSDGTSSVVFDASGQLEGFDGNASMVEVDFAFRFDQPPGETDNAVAVIQFGFNAGVTNVGAVRFGIRADGTLTYSNGASSSIVVKGFKVDDATTWTKVSAVLDYQAKEYTFFINGKQQGGTFRFQGTENLSTSSLVRFQNVGSPEHRGIVVDEVSLTVK